MEEKKEIQDLLIGEQLRDLSFLWIKPAEVEQPYRDLLCHEHDVIERKCVGIGFVVCLAPSVPMAHHNQTADMCIVIATKRASK